MEYVQKKSHALACIMLAIMLGLLIVSIRNESAIVDELAHIPAGFSYVTLLDYRLNPEHPPLLKAMSGLFVYAIVHPHFPVNISSWKDSINGQWDIGYSFLYESGNNADSIIFWARIPVILLSILLGWLLYQWVHRRFGIGTALLTLAFFCFSPTMLAHARYVTTDLGASFGFFIGIASFINLLERPTLRNTLIAGFCFGIAELLKFSLVLLVPMDAIIFILWTLSMPVNDRKQWIRSTWLLFKQIVVMLIIALAVVWAVYGIVTYHYPQERQLRDTTQLLSSYGFRPIVNLDLALIKNPITRPLGHYLLGVLMVQQRAAGGNTAYFLGQVSNKGSRLYFPLLYIVKEPLPLHIFSLIALFYAIAQFCVWRKNLKQAINTSSLWRKVIQDYFVEWSCGVVILVYWIISIKSPLNIGIRHVLPTFPFIYILVSRGVTAWIHRYLIASPHNWKEMFRNIITFGFSVVPRYAISILLLFWLLIGTLTTAPYFLSFYNELGNGTAQGWNIAVDSNYDWGQDLKRLADFVKTNKIQKISLDYFGGGVPHYYMGDHVQGWSSAMGQPKGWFAISATFRQGSFGTPVAGFTGMPATNYNWLKQYPPIARAGSSIFIYKLPE